ncbi:hypothetical protein KY289_011627 [Solanum tuberosum]|nr:hypothetical protein KY289_011627 [Solanum tuberosum]
MNQNSTTIICLSTFGFSVLGVNMQQTLILGSLQVSCPNLERLCIDGANNMSALFSHQLPTPYLSKLEILEVHNCGKLRNLMSPSVAKGLLNLEELEIENCQSMEELITKGEGVMTLFPLLKELKLTGLPKLGHFFLTECTLEFHFSR